MWRPKKSGSRLDFYVRAVAVRTWTWIVAAYGVLGLLLFFRDNFASADTQAQWKLLDILHRLGWRTLAESFFAVVFVAMCEGTYREYQEERRGRLNAERKLKEIEDARPRLIPRFPNPVYAKAQDWFNQDGSVAMRSLVARVAIINDPPISTAASIARNVIAYIRITHSVGVLEMDGRWADKDQPALRPRGQSRIDLLEMDFNIGATHELDLIIKYPDEECFGLNNDNSNFLWQKNPVHRLAGDKFHVEVRLRGQSVDESFTFDIISVPHSLKVTQPQQ